VGQISQVKHRAGDFTVVLLRNMQPKKSVVGKNALNTLRVTGLSHFQFGTRNSICLDVHSVDPALPTNALG